MKTFCLSLALMLSLALLPAAAQQKRKPVGEPELKPGESAIVERGAHHRVWKHARVATLPGGQLVTNISSYTELVPRYFPWLEG